MRGTQPCYETTVQRLKSAAQTSAVEWWATRVASAVTASLSIATERDHCQARVEGITCLSRHSTSFSALHLQHAAAAPPPIHVASPLVASDIKLIRQVISRLCVDHEAHLQRKLHLARLNRSRVDHTIP